MTFYEVSMLVEDSILEVVK